MTWPSMLKVLEYGLGIPVFLGVQCLGILLEPFELPGLWVQFVAAVVFTYTTGHFGWPGCVLLLFVASAGEGLGWIFKKFGFTTVKASKLAVWSAVFFGFCGGVLGIFVPVPVPFFGSMILSFLGTFLGAIVGEMIHEQRLHPNLKVAFGAVMGRACSIAARLALAFFAACLALVVLCADLIIAARG